MRLRGKMLIIGGLVLLALYGFAAAADGNASGSAPGAKSFLWGAWIGPQFTGSEPPWNWQAVKDFEARNARGKHVNLVHWGVGTPWEHQFRYWLGPLNRARSAGAVSLIDMDTASVPLRNVADGAYDSALRTWASQAQSWGHPLLLRLDWEMNGRWFPWGTRPSNLNTAAEFVAAWRHMHDIFAGAGASNVLWVWCPNAIPPRHAMTNPVALYPGDAYVDWTCLDAYNFDKPWTSFSRLFAASYRLDHATRAHQTDDDRRSRIDRARRQQSTLDPQHVQGSHYPVPCCPGSRLVRQMGLGGLPPTGLAD